jgi:kynureninase
MVCDSTSVNLYKLVMAALRMRPGRTRIISDTLNFPSDLYILQGCIQTLGSRHTLHAVPSGGRGWIHRPCWMRLTRIPPW